jgi:hypothetical protein
MRALVFAIAILVCGSARAEIDDPATAMRQAAIEQAETTPPPPPAEMSLTAREHVDAKAAAAQAAAHQAAVEAARGAAEGKAAAITALGPGPSRGAAARSLAQDGNQRGAATAAHGKMVRGGKPPGGGRP